jgi:hypothetical protein
LNIFAYVDDFYLFREYDHLLAAISSLTAHLSERPRLSINDLKPFFYPKPDSPPVHPSFSFVILGTAFGSAEFGNNFVSKAIEKSRTKLDTITKLELLLVGYCITLTIVHLTRSDNPYLLHDLTDQHHGNIIQFLKGAICSTILI